MDPISAMRMTMAGRITPFNPPVLGQSGKIGAGELSQLGSLGDLSKLVQGGTAIDPSKVSDVGNLGPVKLPNLGPAAPGQLPTVSGGRSFSDFLGEMVRDVNAKQATAGNAVDGVLSGEPVPLHQAVLAVEEANVSFQLMVEVRNKLLESYQELMRMQI